jgi:hypothetical protein
MALALKNSRAGHMGHVTKLYLELEELMSSSVNRSRVIERHRDLEEAFAKLCTVHNDYVKLLDSAEVETVEGAFEAQYKNKFEFDTRLQEWLKQCVPAKASSVAGSNASARSKMSDIRKREALGRLQFEQMQQKHEFQRRRQELEQQEQLMLLQGQMEQLRLESEMVEDECKGEDDLNIHAGPVIDLPTEHNYGLHFMEAEKMTIPSKAVPVKLETPLNPHAPNWEHILTQQQQTLQSLASGFNLPRPELLTFDGNPQNYYKFISSFDTNIAGKIFDPQLKLSYLIQQCSGTARECIEDCVVMNPDRGYEHARNILKARFGKPHIIANAYISELVDGPQVRNSDNVGLQKVADQMRRCELTLTEMGYTADMNNTETLRKIVRRLPFHVRAKWVDKADRFLVAGVEPSFSHLTEFVENRARVANTMYGQDLGSVPSKKAIVSNHYSAKKATTLATQGGDGKAYSYVKRNEGSHAWKCPSCSGAHGLLYCKGFAQKSFSERQKITRDNKLCDNCFRKGHYAKGCMDKGGCDVEGCRRKHHSLLHPPASYRPSGDRSDSRGVDTSSKPSPVNIEHTEPKTSGQCTATSGSNRVCLRVVPIRVKSENTDIETYALLDEGSDVSLCTADLANKLGLKGVERNFSLNTVDREGSMKKGREVKLSVSSLNGDKDIVMDKVWTVDRLPIAAKAIPKQSDVGKWPHLNGLRFPEIEDKEVTLLIGSDVPEAFWVMDQRRGKTKEPYALRSVLGWTLLGPVNKVNDSNNGSVNFIAYDKQLHQQVEQFWKLDFETDLQPAMSREDHRALDKMESSVSWHDGHYELGLPWRQEPVCLPNNRYLAEARLLSLKRRFERDETLFEKYKSTVGDYIVKGYAEKVPTQSEQGPVWYLPHHPVVHPQKPEKVRVVYDCAAKFKGTSLNDKLLQGPDLTNNLVGVLTRFRQEPVALMGDVEAMFHQVKVAQADRDALRFLWWTDGDLAEEPDEYRMAVHLFGATSSPSCASFSLRKTANDNKEDFDIETVNTVLRNFYVDDCLKSVETDEKGARLVQQLCELLAKGGFRLTKWISNSRHVLAGIPENDTVASLVNLDLEDLPVERALGVKWNVETDKFQFGTIKGDKPVTRRGILSVVSSLHDPLGFMAPFILPAKMLLQTLCKQNLGWDEPVDNQEAVCWQQWLDGLDLLDGIAVDRCFKPAGFEKYDRAQLHHFADASQSGYGAVSYLRLTTDDGQIHCSFVLGKSRLAPVKAVTIPRLELMAAVLAVKLDQMIKTELDIPIDDTIFWTDSMIVLHYIKNESKRFQTFVANRLATIHETSTPNQWQHVGSTLNPADDASRGLRPDQTERMQRWLSGPEFLWTDESNWPKQPDSSNRVNDDDPELKCDAKNCLLTQEGNLDMLLNRFSSWNSLQRSVAWLLRFKTYCCNRYLKKGTHESCARGELSVKELRVATLEIVGYVQRQIFPKEWTLLERTQACDALGSDKASVKTVGSSSPLRKLCPRWDNGVLRVGGRLDKAPIRFEAKHPLILPSKHHVTDLIIRHHHLLAGHSGPVYVLASLRQVFWVLKGHAAVRRVLGNCFSCKRRNASKGEQYMAVLPEVRLTPDKAPFTYVGVDYFGPLVIKQARSHVKRYGCIFTCLTTRAVHIEIAHTLEADSFLSALQRFISRRGKPESIYSDNGTNFKAGDRELRDALKEWNQAQISRHLSQREIQWHFNPPAASHMGGVWERMIRSIRQILRAVIKEQLVTDETLLTVMAEVEKVLNDRPLTPLSNDPLDPTPLTPSNLLLLRSNSSLPIAVCDREHDYARRRWRQAQYLASLFWRRWLKEYLPTLQIRQKWTQPRRNLKVNDLVLMVDESAPRGQWPLGRVVEVYADTTGFVRSAKVRTASSSYVRPITKLCFLESDVDHVSLERGEADGVRVEEYNVGVRHPDPDLGGDDGSKCPSTLKTTKVQESVGGVVDRRTGRTRQVPRHFKGYELNFR